MKVAIIVNERKFGGVQLNCMTMMKYTNINMEIISRSPDGGMGFKVIENINDRIKYLNTFDVIDFQTNGSTDIPELPYMKTKTIETIHSVGCSQQKTDMKIGVSDCVSLIQDKPCVTCYPGIDFDRTKKLNKKEIRDKYGIPNDMIIVGRCGRLVAEKLPDHFCQVAKRIKGVYYILPWIGESVGWLQQILEGTTHNFLSGMMAQEFYSVVDIVLYPTQDESFCNVYFESMLAGVPIITYNIPVANEFDINIRVPFGNIDELTNATQQVINNNELRKRLIDHGNKTIKKFNVKDLIKKREEVYYLLGGQNE